MILSASWAPISAGRLFATAGRDKAVKIWKLLKTEGSLEAQVCTTMTFSSAVTAVDIAPRTVYDELLIAIGTENGEVSVSKVGLPNLATKSTYQIEDEWVETISQACSSILTMAGFDHQKQSHSSLGCLNPNLWKPTVSTERRAAVLE